MSKDEAASNSIFHAPAHEGKDLNKANASDGYGEFDNSVVNILQYIMNGTNYHRKTKIEELTKTPTFGYCKRLGGSSLRGRNRLSKQ
jgi:hypothetical protein